MENFIYRHKNKLIVLFCTCFCLGFIMSVKDGGAIFPKIYAVRDDLRQTNIQLNALRADVEMLIQYKGAIVDHTHRYHDGRVLQ